jgi:hypothetical protein
VYVAREGSIIGGARISASSDPFILAKDDSFGFDKSVFIALDTDKEREEAAAFAGLNYINVRSGPPREDIVTSNYTIVGKIHFYPEDLSSFSVTMSENDFAVTPRPIPAAKSPKAALIRQMDNSRYRNLQYFYGDMNPKDYHIGMAELFGEAKAGELELADLAPYFGNLAVAVNGGDKFDSLIKKSFNKGKTQTYTAEEPRILSVADLIRASDKTYEMIYNAVQIDGDVLLRLPCAPIIRKTIDLVVFASKMFTITFVRARCSPILGMECWMHMKRGSAKLAKPEKDSLLVSDEKFRQLSRKVRAFNDVVFESYIGSLSALYGITRIFDMEESQAAKLPLHKLYLKRRDEIIERYKAGGDPPEQVGRVETI